MELFVHGSIADIPKAEWSAWFDTDYPFLRHDFLLGLERSECTTQTSGWVPFHLVLREHGRAIAAAPGFLKGHSYGEYVFDWLGQMHGTAKVWSITQRSSLQSHLHPPLDHESGPIPVKRLR